MADGREYVEEAVKAALVVRVNGVVIRRVKIREYISGGQPTGEQELIIFDPMLGSFVVDDSFVFEVKDLALPEMARRTLPNDGWQQVSLRELLRLLTACHGQKQGSVRGSDPEPLGPTDVDTND